MSLRLRRRGRIWHIRGTVRGIPVEESMLANRAIAAGVVGDRHSDDTTRHRLAAGAIAAGVVDKGHSEAATRERLVRSATFMRNGSSCIAYCAVQFSAHAHLP
jgi:hypothetical protein